MSNPGASKQKSAMSAKRVGRLRILYMALLRFHPKPFRKRFADEMLWIFDQAVAEGGAMRLFTDALTSLARQWLLRPDCGEKPLAAAGAHARGGPSFQCLEDTRPRFGVLVQGGLLSLATFCLVTYAIGRGGGSPPSLLFGVHFPREGLIPVARSSIEPAELTTEVKVRLPAEDPWRQLAKLYFGTVLVLGTLDVDDDLVLSPVEISNAPAMLRKLDLDGDGSLSAQEAGQRFGDDAETVAALDPEFVRQAGVGFMRLHPVLAALDADHNGAISTSEIDGSPAALKTLDNNGDGSIIAPELLPDPAANEAVVYFSRLDANRDGEISQSESENAQGEQLRELLDRADRNQDGVVTEQELIDEIQFSAARKQALDSAVRSAFGPRSDNPSPVPLQPDSRPNPLP